MLSHLLVVCSGNVVALLQRLRGRRYLLPRPGAVSRAKFLPRSRGRGWCSSSRDSCDAGYTVLDTFLRHSPVFSLERAGAGEDCLRSTLFKGFTPGA